MTQEQLSVICSSFEKACLMSPDLGSRFYTQLSSDYPETMNIFASVSMNAQHTRFISMLRIILTRMTGDQPFIPLLEELGRKHRTYCVGDEEFEKFGITMMKVLQATLGNEFDEFMRDAWFAVYNELTGVMKSAINHSQSHV